MPARLPRLKERRPCSHVRSSRIGVVRVDVDVRLVPVIVCAEMSCCFFVTAAFWPYKFSANPFSFLFELICFQ